MEANEERGAPAPGGASPSSAGPTQPSLLDLSAAYFRIGNTTFGGGVPTMAALQRELVHRKEWLSPEDYGLAFALARVTPGTNILAFVAATGSQILGMAGALAGTLAVTIPSAILALMITVGYERWSANPIVLAGIEGTVAAVSGMMIATVWSLIAPFWAGLKPGRRMQTFRTVVFAGGAFLLLWLWDVSPLKIIGLAVAGGLLWEDPSMEKGNASK
ncbi:MAG: chromate transporter [Bryobacteraceae bacterium]